MIRYLLCLRNWVRIQEADSDGDDADDEADEEVLNVGVHAHTPPHSASCFGHTNNNEYITYVA
jgi:hypothetical protein